MYRMNRIWACSVQPVPPVYLFFLRVERASVFQTFVSPAARVWENACGLKDANSP